MKVKVVYFCSALIHAALELGKQDSVGVTAVPPELVLANN